MRAGFVVDAISRWESSDSIRYDHCFQCHSVHGAARHSSHCLEWYLLCDIAFAAHLHSVDRPTLDYGKMTATCCKIQNERIQYNFTNGWKRWREFGFECLGVKWKTSIPPILNYKEIILEQIMFCTLSTILLRLLLIRERLSILKPTPN